MSNRPTRKPGKAGSPAAYSDVHYVMEAALERPNLIYECDTPGAAINFKLRCNRYRNLLREMEAERIGNIPGLRAETVFDTLVISQVDDEGKPDRQGRRLCFRHQQLHGRLIDPDTGEEIRGPNITGIIK